jgi:hypothetical protein
MENEYEYMKQPDNSAVKIVKHNSQTHNDLEVELDFLHGDAKINLVDHKTKEIHSVKMTGSAFKDLMDLCERIKLGDALLGKDDVSKEGPHA